MIVTLREQIRAFARTMQSRAQESDRGPLYSDEFDLAALKKAVKDTSRAQPPSVIRRMELRKQAELARQAEWDAIGEAATRLLHSMGGDKDITLEWDGTRMHTRKPAAPAVPELRDVPAYRQALASDSTSARLVPPSDSARLAAYHAESAAGQAADIQRRVAEAEIARAFYPYR